MLGTGTRAQGAHPGLLTMLPQVSHSFHAQMRPEDKDGYPGTQGPWLVLRLFCKS